MTSDAVRRLEVERHAALVAVEEQVGGGLAIPVGRPGARLVAGAGVLHLDDVGAEIAEEGPAPGAGDDAGEIDHADAVESERERIHARYYTAAPPWNPAGGVRPSPRPRIADIHDRLREGMIPGAFGREPEQRRVSEPVQVLSRRIHLWAWAGRRGRATQRHGMCRARVSPARRRAHRAPPGRRRAFGGLPGRGGGGRRRGGPAALRGARVSATGRTPVLGRGQARGNVTTWRARRPAWGS